jgi:5-formyltetrahydrofolate cyclo-ligase
MNERTSLTRFSALNALEARARMPSSRLHLEILAWRKEERRRLIEERLAISAEVRCRSSREIAEQLSKFFGVLSGRTVSAYWPFRGEPDLRPWIRGLTDLGARFALPVVVEKNLPLIFRIWQHGDRLVPGIWNIPGTKWTLTCGADVGF